MICSYNALYQNFNLWLTGLHEKKKKCEGFFILLLKTEQERDFFFPYTHM